MRNLLSRLNRLKFPRDQVRDRRRQDRLCGRPLRRFPHEVVQSCMLHFMVNFTGQSSSQSCRTLKLGKGEMREVFVIGAAAIWLGMSALAQGQAVSLKGHWRADFKRSYDPYSSTHPRSVVLNVITDNGQIFEAKETEIQENGKIISQYIRTRVDGKFYPVQGSPYNTSVAISHWTPGSIRMQLRIPSSLHSTENCKVSKDLQTMICNEIDTNLQSNSTFARSVYVRN